MKLLYKPIALIAGLISGLIGRSVFRKIWGKIDHEPPPKPGTGEGSVVKVVSANALEAGVMAGVGAAVDRVFANTFHHLIGIWPEKPDEKEKEKEKAEAQGS